MLPPFTIFHLDTFNGNAHLYQHCSSELKVMKTLFYDLASNANPGEVSWTDFLRAMISTGFQLEKLYGSVWQCSPTRLDVERSIQFHEPHPVAKIPFRNARRIGRRLNKQGLWVVGCVVQPKSSYPTDNVS